tara:strand:- start:798 stop:2198 length:1401 start_codon:yes stop_codon:yes gene_type:complete
MLEIINNPLTITIAYVIFVIIVIVAIWHGYQKLLKWQAGRPIFIRKPREGKDNEFVIKSEDIPESEDGYSYALMFWMHLDDFEHRIDEWRHILHKGTDDEGEDCQPGIWITPKKNNMIVRYDVTAGKGRYISQKSKVFKSMKSSYYSKHYYEKVTNKTIGELKEMTRNKLGFIVLHNRTHTLHDNYLIQEAMLKIKHVPQDRLVNAPIRHNEKHMTMTTYSYAKSNVSLSPEVSNGIEDKYNRLTSVIENIPLNRWTHYCINVGPYSADVFVDGKLRQTTAFGSLIKQNKGNIYVGHRGGFGGRLTQLRMQNGTIRPDQALTMYNLGPDPPTIPDIRKLTAKLVPKVKFKIAVKTDIDIPFIRSDPYMLCDEKKGKEEIKRIEKEEGKKAAQQWSKKRKQKLTEAINQWKKKNNDKMQTINKLPEGKRKAAINAEFCKDHKKRGKLSLDSDELVDKAKQTIEKITD